MEKWRFSIFSKGSLNQLSSQVLTVDRKRAAGATLKSSPSPEKRAMFSTVPSLLSYKSFIRSKIPSSEMSVFFTTP